METLRINVTRYENEDTMKIRRPLCLGFYCLVLFLLVCGIASGATTTVSTTSNANSGSSTSTSSTTTDSSSFVYISGIDYNPQVFYPYEQGIVTVHLTNSGTTSVGVSQPDLIGTSVHVTNSNSFQTLSYIGPGATMDVSFVVQVGGTDGTFYPLFTIGTKDSNAIHFPIKVVVDSTDIRATVIQKPDNFAISRSDIVNLSIVNARDGPINNVIVTTSGTGLEISPSEAFISTLNAGSSNVLSFKVDPNQQTDLTFHIAYENGDNKHNLDVALPINIGEDKTGANPVINNIALTPQGNSYQMTGDVSNAGITDAKSMVISLGAPAKGVEPYANYAIGSLASDDFSSFTLTFTSNDLSAVPVNVQWKDAEGNTFSTTTTLDLRTIGGASLSGTRTSGSTGSTTGGAAAAGGATGGAARGGGGGIFGFGGSRSSGLSSFYPVIAAGIIIVAGIVLYTKRKWIAKKLKKQ
jgi:hypothetical protein